MTAVLAILVFASALVLQLNIVGFLSVWGIAPDPVMLLVIMWGSYRGRMVGVLIGFSVGLCADWFGAGVVGLSSLSYAIAAFIAGFSQERREFRLVSMLIAFLPAILVHDFIYYMIFKLETSFGFFRTLFAVVMPTSLYNIVFLAIIFLAVPPVFLGKRKN